MSEQESEGIKYDQDKPDWSLLPLQSVEAVVKVLTFGAKKYSPDNWRKVPELQNRYFAACMRHLAAHRAGELLDKESGLPHISHALCCLFFIAEDARLSTVESVGAAETESWEEAIAGAKRIFAGSHLVEADQVIDYIRREQNAIEQMRRGES